MDVERETVVEVAVSMVTVGLFVALIVGVGMLYSTDGGFTETGALALVGAIVLFVLVMAGVGIGLSRR